MLQTARTGRCALIAVPVLIGPDTGSADRPQEMLYFKKIEIIDRNLRISLYLIEFLIILQERLRPPKVSDR